MGILLLFVEVTLFEVFGDMVEFIMVSNSELLATQWHGRQKQTPRATAVDTYRYAATAVDAYRYAATAVDTYAATAVDTYSATR